MTKIDEKVDELKAMLRDIELDVTTSYTLADAIREGSMVTSQNVGSWGNGENACALTAATIAAKSRGFV
jgi:hypothetical protein